jgi:hypothetical protein
LQHTISIPLKQKMTSRDIRNLYQDRYAGEKLVKIVGEAPLVKDIAGRHGVEIGGFAVHSSGERVVVCATIDNLLKGAATQCLRKSIHPPRTNQANLRRKHELGSGLLRVRGYSSRLSLPLTMSGSEGIYVVLACLSHTPHAHYTSLGLGILCALSVLGYSIVDFVYVYILCQKSFSVFDLFP